MARLLILLAVLAAAAGIGLVWRSRSGRARVRGIDRRGPEPGVLAALGVGDDPVTLVQFSTAFCQPCRATRRILDRIASETPGVRHLEVDAESHLDAVRALRILRTPTTLLVDAEGRIRNRVVGQPLPADVSAALAPLLGTGVSEAERRAPDGW